MTTPHISGQTEHDPTASDAQPAVPGDAASGTAANEAAADSGDAGAERPTSAPPRNARLLAGPSLRSGTALPALRDRIARLLTWLGGGGAEIPDRHERSAYAVTGTMVLLFAAISGAVVTAATAASHWPVIVVVLVAVLAVLLIATISRALATAALPSRAGARIRLGGELIGRLAVAVLAGVVVAELASTILLGGTIDRRLDENARRDAESAPTVVTARNALDQAKADRDALDRTISGAQSDIEHALIVARCEYHPTPQCPQDEITGIPGQGPETRTDNSMLDDARARLAAAQSRTQAAQDLLTRRQQALDQARAAAFRTGDRGLGARWIALNAYTFGHAGAFLLRLASLIITVTLALLPLLSRWWRGETAFDRSLSARAAADRADQDAATAIARKRAEVRTEAEKLRADQELAAARLAVHADTVIDREQQRRRVIASIGAVEIGVTAPQRRAVAEFEALAELPAAPNSLPQEDTMSQPSNLPAPIPRNEIAPAAPGGLELPIIGTVPFTDTAARWIRPLVPSFVTDAIDTATHPLRTVRQAFEETEEITFTLRRTRKVTVDSADSAAPHPTTAVSTTSTGHAPIPPAPAAYGLPDARTALTATPGPAELDQRGTRELPPGSPSR